MKFNELYWHDAVLTQILINRENPGYNDIITFIVDFENLGIKKIVLVGVHKAVFNMNFGVIAGETIFDATETCECELLKEFHATMKDIKAEFNLKCYTIDLNSTGSNLKILAKGFKILQ